LPRRAGVVGGVAQWSSEGVDPSWWGDPGDAVGDRQFPGAAVVDLVVVSAAGQGEVVQVGRAAVGPPGDVVGVAGVGGDGAAGDDAAAVAGGQRGLLRRTREALGP